MLGTHRPCPPHFGVHWKGERMLGDGPSFVPETDVVDLSGYPNASKKRFENKDNDNAGREGREEGRPMDHDPHERRPARRGRGAGEFSCETCGRVATSPGSSPLSSLSSTPLSHSHHPNCLVKHRWEHNPYWSEASQFLLSKHQQVQLTEAAGILTRGRSLPTGLSGPDGALPPSGSRASSPLRSTRENARTVCPRAATTTMCTRRRRKGPPYNGQMSRTSECAPVS